jgi:hypothetical protein
MALNESVYIYFFEGIIFTVIGNSTSILNENEESMEVSPV